MGLSNHKKLPEKKNAVINKNSFGTDTKTLLYTHTLLIMTLNTMWLFLIINKSLEKISKGPEKD